MYHPQSISATLQANIMLTFLLLVAGVFSSVITTPLPSAESLKEKDVKVLYDQRQDGEWNVHADLKNFVIMVIPSSSSSTSGSTLLDYLVRMVPKRGHFKHSEKKVVPGEETMHFIESKTAPYHVDISRSKSHLAKLHPEVPTTINAEEIVIAESPKIELLKDDDRHSRIARAFVVTVPQEEGYEKKKDGKKKKEIVKSVLKLLGAENEQCGPGLERDLEGVCRPVE